MRTCTLCNAQSPDEVPHCVKCGAGLSEHSTTAVALARFRANPRVRTIRVIPNDDCCPTCLAAEGEFPKEEAPDLPVPGCSHPLGCRCYYEPELTDIFP